MWPFSGSKHNGRELVANGALLLDVRTPEEFRDRHLEGAKERPVVVYCRSGARSASAATLMKGAGYEVLDIGGIGNW
jgi:rhodanese-related sulfurtransferase